MLGIERLGKNRAGNVEALRIRFEEDRDGLTTTDLGSKEPPYYMRPGKRGAAAPPIIHGTTRGLSQFSYQRAVLSDHKSHRDNWLRQRLSDVGTEVV